jgi:hypothetical protein
MAVIGFLLAVLKVRGEQGGPAGLVCRVLMVRLVLMHLNLGLEFQSLAIGLTRTAFFLVPLFILVRGVAGPRRAPLGGAGLAPSEMGRRARTNLQLPSAAADVLPSR